MTHFADGTKLSMELNVLANGTGFKVGKRGMYGPSLAHVNEAPAYYSERIIGGGKNGRLYGRSGTIERRLRGGPSGRCDAHGLLEVPEDGQRPSLRLLHTIFTCLTSRFR